MLKPGNRLSIDHLPLELPLQNIARIGFDTPSRCGVSGGEIRTHDAFFVGRDTQVAAVPTRFEVHMARLQVYAAIEARALQIDSVRRRGYFACASVTKCWTTLSSALSRVASESN